MNKTTLNQLLENPLVAILRGVTPNELPLIANRLLAVGIRCIEVPLNSPRALSSIELLRDLVGEQGVVGAGTVMTVPQVLDSVAAGANLVLSPHLDPVVIRMSLNMGAIAMPGVATITEALAARNNGAECIKIFPADALGVRTIKGWSAVMPKDVHMFAVGGVDRTNIREFREAGVVGVGLGSSFYRPGISADLLEERAKELLIEWGQSLSLANLSCGP